MKKKRGPYITVPYRCPKCCSKPQDFYGMLKLPGVRLAPCPNCGTRLTPSSEQPTL